MKITFGNYGVNFSEGNLKFVTPQAISRTKKSWADLHNFFQKYDSTIEGNKETVGSQLAEYSGWVYDCVNIISNRTSSIGYSFVNIKTGEKIDTSSTTYGVVSKPIRQPNEYMSWSLLNIWMQSQLDLTGMCFAQIKYNKLGVPFELWPINVNDFKNIYVNPKYGFPVTFEFEINGKNTRLSAKDLLYIWYPDPKSPWQGISPIQANARMIDIENYIEIYEKKFFKNSARYDIALATEKVMTEDEAFRVKEMWEGKFKGVDNAHKVAVLHSGLQALPLTSTNKDFEFVKLAGWTQDKILAAYNVPSAKLGLIKDVNRANGFEVDVTFNRDCVQPRLFLWEEQLNAKVFSKFDPNLHFQFDNPVPSDKEKLDEIMLKKVEAGIWTRNEARKLDNLVPLDGGDVVYIPFNLVPMGSSVRTEADNDISDEEDNKGLWTQKKLDVKWKAFDKTITIYEAVWYSVLSQYFSKQRDEVINNLKNNYEGKSVTIKLPVQSYLFDYTVAEEELQREVERIYRDVLEESGQTALTEVGVVTGFNVNNPNVQMYVSSRVRFFSREVLGTRVSDLEKTLQEGLVKGESLPDLIKRVESVYGKLLNGRWEAQRIAQTETISAYNRGSLFGYQQSGVVQKKGWLASPDERTRDTHAEAGTFYGEKGAIPLNDNFIVGAASGPAPGSMNLAEENVQCRCSIFPIVDVIPVPVEV